MNTATGKRFRPTKLERGFAGARLALLFISALSSIGIPALSQRPTGPSQSARALHPVVKAPGKSWTGEVMEAEKRLNGLGYWTGAVDGVLDVATAYAVTAAQKVAGRKRTGKLDRGELEALKEAKPPVPLETGYVHIEVDLRRQVLFMVGATGNVSRILPISSGSGKMFTSEGRTRRAITPSGRFTIINKIRGWRKSPLGLLYYPSYITSYGVAIHGNPSVPAHPASHGCIRIPMFAAKEFSEMTPVGTPVIVYDKPSPSTTG